jgi:hypothetical protein
MSGEVETTTTAKVDDAMSGEVETTMEESLNEFK